MTIQPVHQTFPECVPLLTDGRVLLRAHDEADIPRIVEQCVDPESVRWTTVPSPYSEKDGRQWFDTIRGGWEGGRGPYLWAVTDAADPDTFFGTIDVRDHGSGIGFIGFGLHPEGRGRGLMAAALRLATRWWWDRGGVRMHWQANRGNVASWRVARACGFTYHALIPAHLPQRGEALDSWNASVGRDDDLTRPATPWWEPVPCHGDGIRLRPWRAEDVDAVPASDTTPLHLPAGDVPTRDRFEDWLLRTQERGMTGGALSWCVADARSDTALGNVVLVLDRHRPHTAELGCALFATARGRGVATWAARLACEHAFRSRREGGLGMERIVAVTVGDNDPRSPVLAELGFRSWGREPGAHRRADGSFDDARHWVKDRDSPEETGSENS